MRLYAMLESPCQCPNESDKTCKANGTELLRRLQTLEGGHRQQDDRSHRVGMIERLSTCCESLHPDLLGLIRLGESALISSISCGPNDGGGLNPALSGWVVEEE